MDRQKLSGNQTERSQSTSYYEQKKCEQLRREVNCLYFENGLSRARISQRKGVSRRFVMNWTKTPQQDFSEDDRGWPLGNRRKWTKTTEKRIVDIHTALRDDPMSFYWGASAVEQTWRQRFSEKPPPLRTIGKIMADLGLSDKQHGKPKGAAKYLCYPEYTVYERLADRLLEADFVGQKYIKGRTAPLHFIGFSFKKHPKLRYFQRIEAATANNFITQCEHFLEQFETPGAIKVDNAAATIGSKSGKRNLSRVMKFLLQNSIIPVYSVPRRPFSQASIEGNNSLFARKFWNRCEFQDVSDIDRKLQWFNDSSLHYTGYQPPTRKTGRGGRFLPRVYFLRQVLDTVPDSEQGFIDILNEPVGLPKAYVNYFVLVEWHLEQENLTVYLEKEKQLNELLSIPFSINKNSKRSFD